MSAFVGTKRVTSAQALQDLLNQYATSKSRYFLRWAHRVSGFESTLPEDFPSPEGQMFDSDRELRWKQQGSQFEVLMLSTQKEIPAFEPLGEDWTVQKRKAYVYPATETRLPQGIADHHVNITQRYFRNTKSAIVHFVALSVEA